MKSQNQEVLDYLLTGKSITASFAMSRFRVYRLAARICDLRDDGWDIHTTMKKRHSKRTGRTVMFAVYSMTVDDEWDNWRMK